MRYYFPYWNFTSCIHTDSRNVIRTAIINLFEQERECFFLPRIPYLILDTKKTYLYKRPPLLIVGLGIGKDGWTIIKTYPNDWLFLRTPDGKRPRLSALAMQLKCDAFHYRVTDNSESLFLEADATGKFKIEHTNKPRYEPNFSLIKVSNSLQRAIQINRYSVSVDRLDRIEAGEYERIDYFLMKALDPFEYYWQTYDLFEEVYCNFKKLDEINIKLMYFHPPKYYLKSLPIYGE